MSDFREEIERFSTLIRERFERLEARKADLWEAVTSCEDLLPAEQVDEFRTVEQTFAELKDSPISVLIAGVTKAGKSSTANALIEEDEFFPTGAVRKTDRISKREWSGILVVDTPGLDSIENVRDERILTREIRKSDLAVFLFSDKEGELDRITQSFLREHLLPTREVLCVLNKKRDD